MIQNAVRTDGPVRLAALECAASCIVSALDIRGFNPRYFLLGYWHIGYYDGMLMSVRNMKWIDLAYEYGIQTGMTSGSLESLNDLLDGGDMAIILCKASKLRFFPESMLGFESAGFYHCVLLYGRSGLHDSFHVTDPVAGFTGLITADELAEASVRSGEFVYCRLRFDADYRRPEERDSFRRASAANLAAYRKSGAKAFERFRADVADSMGWEAANRRSWTDRNNIALSAISRMRTLVWQSYVDTGLLSEEERAEGNVMIGEVVRAWMNINMQLVKIGSRSAVAGLAEIIRRQLETVERAEIRLLEYLAAKELLPNEN
ncbi:hypothetical protein ACFPPD_10450 [Cohnella suwonensis]|uniref:Butirosin biosynthesis protein H N-terminal domain-containing protein n=1 Tax=Cohnella suwonensis TaxID=696072 RepID=A0ABW0LX47_9BACL